MYTKTKLKNNIFVLVQYILTYLSNNPQTDTNKACLAKNITLGKCHSVSLFSLNRIKHVYIFDCI